MFISTRCTGQKSRFLMVYLCAHAAHRILRNDTILCRSWTIFVIERSCGHSQLSSLIPHSQQIYDPFLISASCYASCLSSSEGQLPYTLQPSSRMSSAENFDLGQPLNCHWRWARSSTFQFCAFWYVRIYYGIFGIWYCVPWLQNTLDALGHLCLSRFRKLSITGENEENAEGIAGILKVCAPTLQTLGWYVCFEGRMCHEKIFIQKLLVRECYWGTYTKTYYTITKERADMFLHIVKWESLHIYIYI